MKIHISGLYSGTNPQPGVGIARSLRLAYPDATLIGVEYSARCSGIHWHELDDVWLQRPWQELNLNRHADAIKSLLDNGGLYISANDLEILWLSEVFPNGHSNLLTPPAAALAQVAKPAVPAHMGLPVGIPQFIAARQPDWELHHFCRQHNWKVWLKGPYYDAVRVGSWTELETRRRQMQDLWGADQLFLQAHVTGYEESIALSAFDGELLDCVFMRKRDVTELSKTWAGEVREVPPEITEILRSIIRDIGWTGGAELEMVRDADGKHWLLEWNPRYPAWIHGATIAGRNIVAMLVEAATGLPFVRQHGARHATEFTRVVLEIPVKRALPLPTLPEPSTSATGHAGKHPSGLPAFAKMLREPKKAATVAERFSADAEPPAMPDSYLEDIVAGIPEATHTPAFIFLKGTAAAAFSLASQKAAEASTAELRVQNAYSIKTNPDSRMLRGALDAGFLAEAISPLEVKAAMAAGFLPEQIILNGPGKWWQPQHLPDAALHAVFCDSIADARRVAAAIGSGSLRTQIAGIRLRPPQATSSRFGLSLDTPDAFEAALEAVRQLPADISFGVHFHLASSGIGVSAWYQLFESMLRWCASIESLTGRAVECIDTGGGWAPDDWNAALANNHFVKLARIAQTYLPGLRSIIAEPGKAVAEPSMALAMRILELSTPTPNSVDAQQEAVVDASIAELSMHAIQPHRILYQAAAGGPFRPLGRGNTQLLGRLCMEHDIVANHVALPQDAGPGDLLLFCDAGAYDKSMSYVFGHG